MGFIVGNWFLYDREHPSASDAREADEVARTLISEGRNAKDCFKIENLLPTYPPLYEWRWECVRHFASLTHDPSVCGLLMPSSYGLDCVGRSEEHLPCDVESVAYVVYWRDGDIAHTADLHECSKSNPQRSSLGNSCCEVAKVAFLNGKNDCSHLKSTPKIYDHCLYSLAWKLRDPSYCEGISSDNPRAACKVQTEALKKDPSICPNCLKPVDSADQIK